MSYMEEGTMFDHVSIGVADIARSKKFYDAALKPLGFSLLSDGESSLGYGEKAVQLWLGATKKPVKADMDSGLHFCFLAKDRAAVDAFHAAALKAGGKDNGKPGVRTDYGPKYYAAFAIDPDGYRIEAYCGKLPCVRRHGVQSWNDDDTRCSSGDGCREKFGLRHSDPGVQWRPRDPLDVARTQGLHRGLPAPCHG